MVIGKTAKIAAVVAVAACAAAVTLAVALPWAGGGVDGEAEQEVAAGPVRNDVQDPQADAGAEDDGGPSGDVGFDGVDAGDDGVWSDVGQRPGGEGSDVSGGGEAQVGGADADQGDAFSRGMSFAEALRDEVDIPREVVRDEESGQEYYKGFIGMDFYPTCPEGRAREIVAEVGGTWVRSWYKLPDWDQMRVRVEIFMGDVPYSELLAVADELNAYDEVMSANVMEYVQVFLDSQGAGAQYYLDGGHGRFEQAWGIGKCEGGVRIAVVDSGFQYSHEDLQDNVAYGYDAASSAMDITDRLDAGNGSPGGHGTKVAGVASAVAANALGIKGASWDASLALCRAGDGNGGLPWANVVACLRFLRIMATIDQGPDVINMSFESHTVPSDVEDDLEDLFSWFNSHGVVLVAAAGNYHANVQGESLTDEEYPACMDHVISVASVDSADVVASDSNRNGSVDISAPGVGIRTTAYGDSYDYGSGTSYAAPQVAAAAALLRAQNPNWSADAIEARLEGTARKAAGMGGAGRTDAYGYGVLDAYAALGGSDGSPNTGGSVAEMYAEGLR